MEIEKLIDRLAKHDGVWCSQPTGYELVAEAAAALEQLQAENERLKKERDDAIRQLKFFAPCAGCKWYRGIKGCAHETGCDNNHNYYEFMVRRKHDGAPDQKG